MSKKTTILISVSAVLAVGSAALWRSQTSAPPSATVSPALPALPAPAIVLTAADARRPLASYSSGGDIRPLPSAPALEEALSRTSRLAYPLRLKAVHALYGAFLTETEAARLRAFVADPAAPEGLAASQVRALKNDVLNLLCLHPGGEAETAALLRALHADETQDAALRDYALQHLAGLVERDPALGWETHWRAAEGADPALAATALLHLLAQVRKERGAGSGERASALPAPPTSASPTLPASAFPALPALPAARVRLADASLRLAADETAPEPSRATALQVCGQLRHAGARDIALSLARSDRAGFPLRIAAVATLGDLGGDPATRDYLTALATGPERRLRVPAESALRRLALATSP